MRVDEARTILEYAADIPAKLRTIAAETLYTFEHAILPRCQIALSADEKD